MRTTTNNNSNKQIKSVKLFLYNFSTMFYKVVSETMYYAKQCTRLNIVVSLSYDNVTPDNVSVTDIMSPSPHHIKRTPSY